MGQRFYLPRERVFTDDGLIAPNYRLFFYETGTTTPKNTYSDSALTVANTNPVVADANGRFGDIFLIDDNYKVVLKTEVATDVTIWTADPQDIFSVSLNSFEVRPDSYWGVTAGTNTAYTLSPNPALDVYSNDLSFSMQMHLTSGASPTLAVEDLNNPGSFLAAKSLKKYDSTGSKIDIVADDLQIGQRYNITYDGTDFVVFNPEKSYKNSLELTEDLVIGEDVQVGKKFNAQQNNETISSDAITYNGMYTKVDTEGSSPSDDLATINGGSNGDIIIISTQNAARDVVIKHNTGNIFLTSTQKDLILTNTFDKIVLKYDSLGARWLEIARNTTFDFASSQTTNGYTYLPNGMIMQWGNVATPGAGTSVVTFPIAFPTACLNVVNSARGAGFGSNYSTVVSFNTTQATVGRDGSGSYWQAIGN